MVLSIQHPMANLELQKDGPGALCSMFDARRSTFDVAASFVGEDRRRLALLQANEIRASLRRRLQRCFCCQPRRLYARLAPHVEPLIAMKEGQIRRKVFLRLLGHPVVIAPFVLGVTGWTAVWALNLATGLGLFAACAGVLGSVGAYLTRLILDDGKTARVVLQEAELKEQQATQAALDELDRR